MLKIIIYWYNYFSTKEKTNSKKRKTCVVFRICRKESVIILEENKTFKYKYELANTEEQKITTKLILEILLFVVSIISFFIIADNVLDGMFDFSQIGGGSGWKATILIPEPAFFVFAMLTTLLSIISIIFMIRTIVATARYSREYAKYSSEAKKVKLAKILSIIILAVSVEVYPLLWGSFFIEILRVLKL